MGMIFVVGLGDVWHLYAIRELRESLRTPVINGIYVCNNDDKVGGKWTIFKLEDCFTVTNKQEWYAMKTNSKDINGIQQGQTGIKDPTLNNLTDNSAGLEKTTVNINDLEAIRKVR